MTTLRIWLLLCMMGHRAIHAVEYTLSNDTVGESVSLVCHDTGLTTGSVVEQGIVCSREDGCQGFWGLPGVRTDGLICKCMDEPGTENDLPTAIMENIRFRTSTPFHKGIVPIHTVTAHIRTHKRIHIRTYATNTLSQNIVTKVLSKRYMRDN